MKKNEFGDVVEGWPIGSAWNFPQHETIHDRIALAQEFKNTFNFPIPMYVDSMTNQFNTGYGAWPDKAYVIFEDKLVYSACLNQDGTRNMMWVDEIESMFE